MLELRIHGVNNTPPHEMLDVGADQVRQIAGDQLAGFWIVDPVVAAGIPPDRPAYTPPQVRREAYSWGGLDRTTIGGSVPFGRKVVVAVVRAAWCLVLPYGLTNLAYWSRDLGASEALVRRTAALVRLFGLGLTLLFVATVVTVASDLVALQYLSSGTARLPSQLAVIAALPPQRRLAVSVLVPVAALTVLWLVSSRTRARYDVDTDVQSTPDPSAPVLRRTGFWNNRGHAAETTVVHLASGAACVAAMTALFAPSRQAAFGWVVPVIAVAAMVAGAVRLVLATDRGADLPLPHAEDTVPRVTWVVAAVSAGSLVVQSLLLAFRPGSEPSTGAGHVPRLEGLTAVPTTTVLILLAMALAGLSLRRVSPWWAVALTSTVGLAALVYLAGWHGPAVAVSSAALVVLCLLALPGNDFQAWRGRAVGVFMLLALGGAMLLSALVVVGIGNWLNGSRGAADLVTEQVLPATTDDPPSIRIPATFAWFDVGLAGAAAGLALAALAVAPFAVRWAVWVRDSRDDASGEPSTVSARRLANAAHRAEPAVGLFAVLALVALVPCVILPLRPSTAAVPTPLHTVTGWGAVFAAALAALLAGALVLQPGTGRPLGLLWDLLCVVPRAAHPLGPPSYSERAVPELISRCQSWLDGGDRRRVVLSAHSMGSVLAVAVLLDRRTRAEHAGALTYGSQLRAYFGRIFPELFGPVAVANAPARAASALAADEFRDDTADAEPCPAESTLLGLLSGGSGRSRWVNLWRQTDYLGFPAFSRRPNPVDVRADEIDRSGYLPACGSHSGYPHVPQYRAELDALWRRIVPGTPARPRK
ncbi:hypothetical protein [Rhodococcus sp. NPDC059234]|uniref:hypothetical protein n=1 Tax=Rhodococcus sp. NPDC059234 TaxID=3346781 RepID=UPI00367347BF